MEQNHICVRYMPLIRLGYEDLESECFTPALTACNTEDGDVINFGALASVKILNLTSEPVILSTDMVTDEDIIPPMQSQCLHEGLRRQTGSSNLYFRFAFDIPTEGDVYIVRMKSYNSGIKPGPKTKKKDHSS